MKLSVSIQAHPDRADLVAGIRHRLTPPGVAGLMHEIPVAWDKEGPPNGNADRGWRTARAAWMLHDPDADWHLVLQDDAVPCIDLEESLERALEHVPADAVVSAYLGRGGGNGYRWGSIVADAERLGASWVRSSKLSWGVAIILPTKLIPDMIEHCDRRHGVTDDMRIAGWAEKRHAEVWYPFPSLVDHRAGQSLTKHRAPNRVAWRHHQGSALELNWSGAVVTDPALRRRTPPRSGPSRHRPVASAATALGTGRAGKRA